MARRTHNPPVLGSSPSRPTTTTSDLQRNGFWRAVRACYDDLREHSSRSCDLTGLADRLRRQTHSCTACREEAAGICRETGMRGRSIPARDKQLLGCRRNCLVGLDCHRHAGVTVLLKHMELAPKTEELVDLLSA